MLSQDFVDEGDQGVMVEMAKDLKKHVVEMISEGSSLDKGCFNAFSPLSLHLLF